MIEAYVFDFDGLILDTESSAYHSIVEEFAAVGLEYDLVAWHPNWEVVRTERNPETGQPSRLVYAPPLETSRPAAVVRGRPTLANLTLSK